MLATRHFFYNHQRLLVAVAAGVIVALAFFSSQETIAHQILAGWNVMVWLYLALTGWMMMRADAPRVRKLAAQEDKSWAAVLAVMSVACMVSLGAVILELPAAHGLSAGQRFSHYVFTAVTVFGSWCLLGVLFTHQYARLFYRSQPERRPLRFPDDEQKPDYWDFLYFSFTIVVAVQTSDVAVMGNGTRKAVLAQSVLCFLFNVAIVGLSINIAASLLGG